MGTSTIRVYACDHCGAEEQRSADSTVQPSGWVKLYLGGKVLADIGEFSRSTVLCSQCAKRAAMFFERLPMAVEDAS